MNNDILQGAAFTALVIDDDEFSREVLREMLAEDGIFSVRMAADGASGLMALASWANVQGEQEDQYGSEKTMKVNGRLVHEVPPNLAVVGAVRPPGGRPRRP